ncbi:MAG: cobyrinate a,c-diamide synthase [Oscillospiraceae bacterium]|nr:cobyrinate a,c-diamide synthase [Oscillospiraceae bacterium]
MRILLAGTHSGCGKTTVSLAVMAALSSRGLSVAPFKAGPDYIDPGFHQAACGCPSDSLDLRLCSEQAVSSMLSRGEARSDIAIVEGVMGYYDGMDSASFRCSTYDLARATRTPVILVVDASGGAASVAAVVKGFASMARDSGIRAVLVNRVSSRGHYELVRDAVTRYAGLPCAGFTRKDAELTMPSRHLGLIPAGETAGLSGLISRAAANALENVDLDMIIKIASNAPPLAVKNLDIPRFDIDRIGVARDDAFRFYYPENLRMMTVSGIELVYFSPMSDTRLPDGLDGLYIGGGFPEVFAERLEANRSMRDGIRAALEGGMRCYAECGGLLYLSRALEGRAMVGFLPIDCRMTDRLQRFGYVNITDETGAAFPAHEFHYAVAEPAEDIPRAFRVAKAGRPEQSWTCGYRKANTLAGFPHLHFGSRPELIARLWRGGA